MRVEFILIYYVLQSTIHGSLKAVINHLFMFAFQMLVSEREEELPSLKGELDVLEKEEGERQASMVDLHHERDKHTTSLKDYQQKMKYYKHEVRTTHENNRWAIVANR